LKSNADCGSANALQALVAFSHHVPGHRESDLAFFDLAKQRYGFVCTQETSSSFPHIFNGSEQEVFLYAVTRGGAK
jgi:hypothetical protein